MSSLFNIIGGGTPKTTVPEYWGGNIPWISVKDFNNEGRFVYKTEKSITEKGLMNSSTKLLKRGDIIISARGTVGAIAVIPFPMAFNQSCYGLRADERIVDKNFLFYLLKHNLNTLKNNAHGSVFDTITKDTFYGINVDIPCLSIQKKIANVLSSIDDKIEINNQINKNLEEQAQSIFSKIINKSSKFVVSLSEIAMLNPRRILSKGKIARYIDMSQLSTSTSFPSGWDYKKFNGGMRFCNGDTLLARITPCLENGKTAYVNFLDDKEVAFGSTEYIVMCSKGIYPNEFFYCLARYSDFVDYAVKNMNGSSGRQRVSAEIVGKYELPKINDSDLQEFMDIVPNLFNICRTNNLENMNLEKIRNTLLPRLMSGEIDVSKLGGGVGR